jgi:branched-chain amino acid transport system permease protein
MVFIYPGLVIGAVFAVLGSSITLTYSVTGILNLGIGAMAYVAADFFYTLVAVHGWSPWLGGLVVVLGLGPVMGFVLWGVVFRRLERSNLVVQMVASIGLSVALPAIMETLLPHLQVGQAPGILSDGLRSFKIGPIATTGDQVAVIVGSVVSVGALALFLSRTRFGLFSRAVVDRPVLAQARGVSPNSVGAASWVLASTLVAFGAVLLDPLEPLDPGVYTTLTIAALSVALVGRFRYLVGTVIGGLALGIVESVVTGEAPSGSELLTSLGPAMPFFLLTVLLLLGRSPATMRQDAVEVPVPARRSADEHRVAEERRAAALGLVRRWRDYPWIRPVAAAAVLAAVTLVGMFGFSLYWTGLIAIGAAFAVLFLSFSVATGEAGVLCLGQAALAGLGAFVAAKAAGPHTPLIVTILVGIAAAMAISLVIGLIGSRLDQVGFALVTLAFAIFCDQFAFTFSWLVPVAGATFQPFQLFGLSQPRSQILLGMICFALLAALFAWLRRGRPGRTFAGIRNNPVRSQSLGVHVRMVRTLAFVVSGGVAGLGGVLLGIAQGNMSPTDVVTGTGLVWLAVVVTTGVRGSAGALLAGLAYGIIPGVFALYVTHPGWGSVPTILFGLGAVALAQEPRGILALHASQLAGIQRRFRRPGPTVVVATAGAGPGDAGVSLDAPSTSKVAP